MTFLLDLLAQIPSADGFESGRSRGRWPVWPLIAEQVVGNAMVCLVCLVMLVLIWRLARQRPELRPLRGLAMTFGLFVGLEGLGHFLDLVAFFRPIDRFSGFVLVVTGAVSGWLAWATFRAWPAIMAMRSPESLERIIAERTRELTRAIDDLGRAEIDRAYLATIVESSNDAIIGKDLNGVITSWNSAAERLYGYPAAEAIGQSVTFLIPDDHLDEEPVILARVRAGKPVSSFETVRQARDGRRIDVSLSISPIKDGSGRIVGVSKIVTNITERKRAQDALRLSESRFRALIETLPQLVWSTGADGESEYSSPQWLAYTGCAGIDELRARWGEILHPDDRPRYEDAWGESLASGEPYDIEYRMRRLDGLFRWFKVRGVPIREVDGQVVRWFGTCTDIDDQMRAEEALRASEERQRRALSAARIGHWEFDVEAKRVTYQNGLKTLYGRGDEPASSTLEESLGFLHPDDRPGVTEAIGRSLAGDVPLDLEHRAVWPDGSIHWLAAKGVVLRDDSGKPVRMVGVNVDVTERKEAEVQVRLLNEGLERRVAERTAELRQQIRLIDLAHDAIMVRSRSGLITSWNQGAERIYGWTRDEALGRVSHDLLKTRFPGTLAAIEAELERLGSWDGELSHERRDGVRIVVESRWVLDREGSADGAILEINGDITDRRASEQALRRSEEALRESQRLAGVGTWEWDPVRDVIVWSEEFCRIAGRDPDRPRSLTDADHAEIFAPESLARLKAAASAAMETGAPYEIELELTGEDGDHRWIISRGEAVHNAEGSVSMLWGTVQDVTARKRFEQELRLARDQAMAAAKAKGEFLANMSHEIRTPMNGVIGMTELLLDTSLEPSQRGYAETIRISGEALLTIIDDILDFSKIEAGKLSLETSVFDLRGLMTEVVDLLLPKSRRKGIEIHCQVAPEIPARLVGDPVRVRQILVNLAGNAVKFTDRGTVSLEARLVSQSAFSAVIRVLVRDTGIGIPEDHHAEVFKSFTQVESGNSRRHGGTGLGLTICRSLVALMGGSIGLASRPGEGSTFWFELPLGLERKVEDQASPEIVDGSRLAGSPRILLAEDNEVNRRVAIGMAERLGCSVDAVRNGREALEAIDYRRHDLVLMDVQMPEMDGFAATAAIREREIGTGLRIPILAMTAHAMSGDRERCLAAGMDGYISKPIRSATLREALMTWTSNASSAIADDAAESESFGDTLNESCGGNPSVILEILGLLMEETPGRLARLGSAIDSEDGRRIYREAHGLRGGFLAVGAEGLASACHDLTEHGRRGDLVATRAAFRNLRSRWARLATELDFRRRSIANEAPYPA